jgi:hypothetical protein
MQPNVNGKEKFRRSAKLKTEIKRRGIKSK